MLPACWPGHRNPLLMTVGRSLVFSTALHTLGTSTLVPCNWAHMATSITLAGSRAPQNLGGGQG